MNALANVLDCLCDSPFARVVAEAISVATDECPDENFWYGVHDQLLESARGVSFHQYHSIAQCHVLCVAAAPDCSETWSGIVLKELVDLAENDSGLDAYVMGSQLGLFQAGKWLQKNEQKLLGGNFLSAMAQYCSVLFGKKCTPVNLSASCRNLNSARQELDRAVKDYLRPQDDILIDQMKLAIKAMLLELQRFCLAATSFGRHIGGSGADLWLLDALVHGSLDVSHRNYHELMRAALVLQT